MKVFLQVKRLGNAFTRTFLNLKYTDEKYDVIRKHHENGRSAPCPTPHCIKMFNILLKNLQIGMKIHTWIAKCFLTILIRTIPYYWKSWLQYLLCPRIFRTTHVSFVVDVLEPCWRNVQKKGDWRVYTFVYTLLFTGRRVIFSPPPKKKKQTNKQTNKTNKQTKIKKQTKQKTKTKQKSKHGILWQDCHKLNKRFAAMLL